MQLNLYLGLSNRGRIESSHAAFEAIDGTQNALYRSEVDIMLRADAKDAASARYTKLDIRDSLRIGAHRNCMLGIGNEGISFDARLTECVKEGVNRVRCRGIQAE